MNRNKSFIKKNIKKKWSQYRALENTFGQFFPRATEI